MTCSTLPLPLPSVWEEVDFDVGVPRSSVFSRRQVLGSQDGDNELVAHFIVPEFNLSKVQDVSGVIAFLIEP